ncbi:MAG: hypothetical protein HYW07_18250 [Candidatus Latescibacteria bacterium]|nr:hypothetical protein [Candidatus Latescibacterota bacterium]
MPGKTALRAQYALLFLSLLSLCTWSCAGRLKTAAAGLLMEDMVAAIDQHDDLELVTQAAPTYLLLLEGLRQDNPHNRRLLTSLAQAYASYATLVEIDDPERASHLYHRAMTYGLQSLALEKRLAPLLGAPYAQFAQLRTSLKPREVETVFWTALSWGAWISTHTDSMAALAELPKVILLMEWVLEQDETLLYGSPHLFLGVYHAAIPAALGGSPAKALYHFDRALALSQGQALMVYVQKARYYARQIFDRQLYVSLLNQALALPACRNPDLVLQNMAARKLARKLLEETDAFF